jgi:hypothetical protein
VRNGSRYAIVNGDKEYELVGELWQIGQFANQWMTLTGVLDRETIKVSSARLATANAIRDNNIKREAMSRSIPSSLPLPSKHPAYYHFSPPILGMALYWSVSQASCMIRQGSTWVP